MSSLVVVANRGPLSLSVAASGELVVRQGAGGLAPSLARALEHSGALWIACALSDGDRLANASGATPNLLSGVDLELLEIAPEIQEQAYRIIANQTLWYMHHAMFDPPRAPSFDHAWHLAWEGYRAFNAHFADAIARRADLGATVVVHDYHLSLVGSLLAEARPDLLTVYFSHTPFATPAELAVLPAHLACELLESMCSFGACGFHTERWASNFRECVRAFLSAEVQTFVAPLGVDVEELERLASTASVAHKAAELDEMLAGRALLLRSDRIEPSKNLVRGFLAFEELLEQHPSLAREVLFVARSYPSRTDLVDYRDYRDTVEQTVVRLNDRFASDDRPCVALQIQDDYDATLACLGRYDVLLVNPIRDGMNLVAKEGPVLNGHAGVLALSTEAGAIAELGSDCLSLQPFDVSATAEVLHQGLSMALAEREQRAQRLAEKAGAHPPAKWLQELLAHARPPAR